MDVKSWNERSITPAKTRLAKNKYKKLNHHGSDTINK
jgi:hypothetical protein